MTHIKAKLVSLVPICRAQVTGLLILMVVV